MRIAGAATGVQFIRTVEAKGICRRGKIIQWEFDTPKAALRQDLPKGRMDARAGRTVDTCFGMGVCEAQRATPAAAPRPWVHMTRGSSVRRRGSEIQQQARGDRERIL